MVVRVSAFIDGFNLYHALHDMGKPHLKWLNLERLIRNFIGPDQELNHIYYFSAHAKWKQHAYKRQIAYMKALSTTNVNIVMGQFKEKDRECRRCGATWKAHEEKETDVNLALCLLNEAYKNSYDTGLLVSRDSDLAPPIRMVLSQFPAKKIKVIAPPLYMHSKELAQSVRSDKDLASIKELHLERSLFPQHVTDAGGNLVVMRPPEYDPPTV